MLRSVRPFVAYVLIASGNLHQQLFGQPAAAGRIIASINRSLAWVGETVSPTTPVWVVSDADSPTGLLDAG
jgi:hypothetical protein